MRLAYRTHRLGPLLALETLLAVLGTLLGHTTVQLPSFSGLGAMPLYVLAALVGAVVLAFPLNAAWPATRTIVVRRSAVIAAVVLITALAPALIVGALAAQLLPTATGFAYLGVLAWLLAMQLVTGVLVNGTYQAMAPVAYVLLCALLGRAGGVVHPWAWPLADAPAAALWVGASALAAALTLFIALGLHREHG
ncbi:hypothetical protein [Agromyces archimandritae]|uniref:Uncharacterized protein n=1 Tax=Agromyces archimandritae TaxID=2781962 RepID=A0A975IPR3_9MICO|nr:hypothetical protein [Agromyces archimandritae]QTX05870.1 hypothetical protein G127AT_06665 [Agromyces archimandritae]